MHSPYTYWRLGSRHSWSSWRIARVHLVIMLPYVADPFSVNNRLCAASTQSHQTHTAVSVFSVVIATWSTLYVLCMCTQLRWLPQSQNRVPADIQCPTKEVPLYCTTCQLVLKLHTKYFFIQGDYNIYFKPPASALRCQSLYLDLIPPRAGLRRTDSGRNPAR